jgi:hypothetical protein
MPDQPEDHLKIYQELILSQWTWIHELRSGEDAFLKIILELRPHLSREVFSILIKYADYKDEIYQEKLLHLEKLDPWLASQIDKRRPPFSSDEPID